MDLASVVVGGGGTSRRSSPTSWRGVRKHSISPIAARNVATAGDVKVFKKLRSKQKTRQFKLRPKNVVLGSGETVTLRLVPRGGRKVQRQIKKLAKRGRRAFARPRITAVDPTTGNDGDTFGALLIRLKPSASPAGTF